MTDVGLYARCTATLPASWGAYAHGSDGGALLRLDGVTGAVFPRGPERELFNNALIERDLGPAARHAAIDALAGAYEAAGVDLATLDWSAYLDVLAAEGAPGLLAGADPTAIHVVGAWLDGRSSPSGSPSTTTATAACSTSRPPSTRAAGASAQRSPRSCCTTRASVTARPRACSRPIAERVYASVGFLDLGRIIELAPVPTKVDDGR